jgi:U3 small nucleolar RNA-associated protein 14
MNTRYEELKAKGYFRLTKEEKKEYQALGKVEKFESSSDVEAKEEETKSEVEIEVENSDKEETMSSVTVEDVKNHLWQAIKDGNARAAILSMSDDKPLVEELNRIRFDQRITNDGQYASQVQNFIDQLTK